MLCLEWAAAAPDGAAAPTELRARIERLTSLGVDVALVARTGIDVVEPQLGARPDVEGRLFLLLSDGAEAYVSGPAGPRLIDRRLVSVDEGEQLTRAVEAVRADLADRGLASRLVERDRWRRVVALTAPAAEGTAACRTEALAVAPGPLDDNRSPATPPLAVPGPALGTPSGTRPRAP